MNDSLIDEASCVGEHKSKKGAVTPPASEQVTRRKQIRVLKAFGSVNFDRTYDYKVERRRRQTENP